MTYLGVCGVSTLTLSPYHIKKTTDLGDAPKDLVFLMFDIFLTDSPKLHNLLQKRIYLSLIKNSCNIDISDRKDRSNDTLLFCKMNKNENL